jgi:FlaA1/EpsC-like NDP-sugar epimerase/lipopolysaccharide/colanic/teichoic acid biosynthesis glycosyltransferase
MQIEYNQPTQLIQSNSDPEASKTLPKGLPRACEALIALMTLILFMPLFFLIALAILFTSKGPILFSQKRVGLKGKSFDLIKFRTMLVATDGLQLTAGDDSRVTQVGKFLRKTKLDELPGLWNVLKGEMALVGIRPEVEEYVDWNNKDWQFILQSRPGITDPVTLQLRNEESLLAGIDGDRERFYLEAVQPFKLKGYREYLETRTWTSDLNVLWRTAVAVIFPATAPPPTAEGIGASSNGHYVIGNGETDEQRSRWITSRLLTRRTQFLLDVNALTIAFVLSYLLRYDFRIPNSEINTLLLQTVYVVALQFIALWLTGIYSFIWRYVGMSEVASFVKATLLSFIPILCLRLWLPESLQVLRVPLSVMVMDTFFALSGVLGLRVLRRSLYEAFQKRHHAQKQNGNGHLKPVLLIGAGRAGMLAAREIQSRGDLNLDIKGFVDDDPQKRNSVINNIKVLGSTRDIPRLVREMKINHVVVTIAETTRTEFRRILDICQKVPVKARTIPGLYEILLGNVKVSRIRDVQIEDLLGRAPVHLDEASVKSFVTGKSVLVTGAGGSIGAELARQVARFQPAKLLLVERAEGALFLINLELHEKWPELEVVPLIGDICDEPRMQTIFETYGPQVVLHAAAHKHVPMMESNVAEAVKNNVMGTQALGEIAGLSGVESFVLISTDKAVRPTSVMGATKRVAEIVVQNLNARFETNYVAVRFGNVIGSAGSVIPIFRQQIARGGPVTVTHPDMVRYFMTIPEAVQLVLQAGAMGKGGEIFILDMGDPIRILDLAQATIKLSGLRPFIDIEILFTGIRPGEKLFEELDTNDERVAKTRHPKVYIGMIASPPEVEVTSALDTLATLALAGKDQELRKTLNQLIRDAQLNVSEESRLVAINLAVSRRILAATHT